MKKWPLFLLIVVGAAAAGIPPLSSVLIEKRLQDFAGNYNLGSALHQRNIDIEVERGYRSTRARLNITVDADALYSGSDPLPDPVKPLLAGPLCIDLHFANTGFAGARLASYVGRPCFSGELAALEKKYWGDSPMFHSYGVISFRGQWRDTTTFNGVDYSEPDEVLTLSTMLLQVKAEYSGDVDFTLRAEGFYSEYPGHRLRLGPLVGRGRGNLRSGRLQAHLSLGNIMASQNAAPPWDIEAVEFEIRQRSIGETLSLALLCTAERAGERGGQYPLEDVRVAFSMRDVDWRSLNTLNLALRELPDGSDEGSLREVLLEHREEVENLLRHQPGIYIDNASVLVGGKRQTLNLGIAYVGRGELADFSWQQEVNADADFEVSRTLLLQAMASNSANALRQYQPGVDSQKIQQQARQAAEQQLALLLAMGFVEESQDEQVTARFKLHAGSATLNDRSVDRLLQLLSF